MSDTTDATGRVVGETYCRCPGCVGLSKGCRCCIGTQSFAVPDDIDEDTPRAQPESESAGEAMQRMGETVNVGALQGQLAAAEEENATLTAELDAARVENAELAIDRADLDTGLAMEKDAHAVTLQVMHNAIHERDTARAELAAAQERIGELLAPNPVAGYSCQRCGRKDGLDAVLHDDDWARIQAASGCQVLCLWCMDHFAVQLDIRRIDTHLAFCGQRLISTDGIACAVMVQRKEQAETALADARRECERYLGLSCGTGAWNSRCSLSALLIRALTAQEPASDPHGLSDDDLMEHFRCPKCGYLTDTPNHELGCDPQPEAARLERAVVEAAREATKQGLFLPGCVVTDEQTYRLNQLVCAVQALAASQQQPGGGAE